MNKFGKSLRSFRHQCNDPENLEKRLSQERFGELIGRELGVQEGYSGAAVSDWERGISTIHAADRLVLISILKVLYQCGGITTLEEANHLLWAGNYRALDQNESKTIFSPLESKNIQAQEPFEKYNDFSQNKGLLSVESESLHAEGIWPPSIPDEPYYSLPDREQYLDELLALLENMQGPRVISIDGLGGLGKTALASELARRIIRKGLYRGVLGETAKQEIFTDNEIIHYQEAILGYEGLLNALARQLQRWDLFTVSVKEKETVLNQILRQDPHIVFVDNLETAKNANVLVTRLRDLLGPSRAIITSRSRVRFSFTRSLTLEGLTTDDSLFFLRSTARELNVKQIINANDTILLEIHQITGGSPLAMKLVTAQAKFLDLDQVLGQLRNVSSKLFSFIFRQSWKQLSPTAQSVLVYIGRTIVETVSLQELISTNIADNRDELAKAVDQLNGLSLLNVTYLSDQIRYSIHQLTRQFVVSDLPQLWKEHGLL